jgi:F-type H+-transporting ATPase subunit delta
MAEPIDKLEDLAEVYAIALFELARKAGLVEQVREELELLVQLEKSEPNFAAFLSSGSVDDDRRADSLERMFRGKLSDLLLNTLQVMNQHERCGLLRVLLRQYVLQQEKALDQVEVVATSAVELGEAQRKEIEALAAALAGRTPLVEFVVEPSVLGGLILQIGDWRYDNSLRTRLKEARGQVLERAERGLEVGAAE